MRLPVAFVASLWCAASALAAASEAPILVAAREGNRVAVQGLLQRRADVDVAQADGTTALHWAARLDDLEMARVLVTAGADTNVRNRYGVSPLSLAARNGSAAMLDLLLRNRADVRAADAATADGQTLLMLAARTGRADAVSLLVAQAVDVNAAEPRTGTTAIAWAAATDRPDAIRVLAQAGADVNARSKLTQYPHTPPAVVGDALEPGVSYVGQTVLPKGGWTPLMYAAREGAIRAIRELADARADLDARDPEGSTALILAVINGHADAVAALLQKGANPNLADETGMTPLYAAVDMHTLASTFGRPDLTPAVVAGSVTSMRALLAAGANPDARLLKRIPKRVYNAGDPRLGEGSTPFMRAARGGDVAVMRLLLEWGADPSLTQKNGSTALLLAAGLSGERDINNPLRGSEQDGMDAIELCLERGVDINAVTTTGDSVVHAALGSRAMIRFLADRGARLDLKNKQGRTPLEAAQAAREPNAETIALLQQLIERAR